MVGELVPQRVAASDRRAGRGRRRAAAVAVRPCRARAGWRAVRGRARARRACRSHRRARGRGRSGSTTGRPPTPHGCSASDRGSRVEHRRATGPRRTGDREVRPREIDHHRRAGDVGHAERHVERRARHAAQALDRHVVAEGVAGERRTARRSRARMRSRRSRRPGRGPTGRGRPPRSGRWLRRPTGPDPATGRAAWPASRRCRARCSRSRRRGA